jgi:hypothetical protein
MIIIQFERLGESVVDVGFLACDLLIEEGLGAVEDLLLEYLALSGS